jgi:hypothetical protein
MRVKAVESSRMEKGQEEDAQVVQAGRERRSEGCV